MAIVQHDDWDLSEKGKKDAERHQKKIDETIRKNVRGVISEESIITRKKGKKVRIPVKGLKDYKFIHGKNEGDGGAGAGQGDGKDGDIIARKPKPGQGQKGQGDKAGQEKGEDYLEAEVDIDYLIQIMFEDLGLPWIEEKTKKENLVPKGWKFETISKTGIMPRIHKKRTMLEAIKRMAAYTWEIIEDTGCSEDDAHLAIHQAKGDLNEAIDLVKNNKLKRNGDEPGVYIDDEDLRFKQIEHDVENLSNAVVIAMMDVSGSMHAKKKYLARSMLFWMNEFLKKMYDNVHIKFITHTTEAKVVDEETFFHKGESGGTSCASAFEKANYIIDTEYPVDEWNVYCIYISDGEDWDPKITVTKIKEMLGKGINMLGYCEILVPYGENTQWYESNDWRTLLKEMLNTWTFKHSKEHNTDFYKSEKDRFLISVIRNKDHVYPTLQHFLFEKKK